MRLSRTELLTGAVAAAIGAGLAAIEGVSAAQVAACAIVGAALAPAGRHLLATRLVALSALAAGAPWGLGAAAAVASAGHLFWAGRREPLWPGLAWVAAFIAVLELGGALGGDGTFVPQLVVCGAAWGAGRALGQREAVAHALAERMRELDEEREAHAVLSVRYERSRIASELHDIVGHAISIMVVQAAAGQRLAARDPAHAAEAFDAIAGAARQAEADMTRLVALLGDDDAIGPAPDLSLVEELVARAVGSGLDATLVLEGEREGLPAPATELAYRIVQEGLTNALRYAAGAPVHIVVRGAHDELAIEVTNAATKTEATLAGAGTGNGIRGLRERVGAVGGRVEAGATPDGGWRLRAALPRRIVAPAAQSPLS
jgi:signal transduction histidine kinase